MSEHDPLKELDFAVRKWIIMSRFEHDQEKYQNLRDGHWIVEVQDAEDGSGDAILAFPDELTLLSGWKTGDTVVFEKRDDNSIYIKLKTDV